MTNLTTWRNRALVALGACVVLAIAAVALLAGSGSSDASAPASPAQDFSGLRAPSAAVREALPEGAQRWLGEVEGGGTLANPEGEPLGGLSVAKTAVGEVVVADFGQSVCEYVVSRDAGTCGSMGLVEAGELFLLTPGCDRAVVVGVLPDGIDSVRVEAADRRSSQAEVIPVSANVYAAELEATDAVLSGTLKSGVSFKTALPLGKMRERAAELMGCS